MLTRQVSDLEQLLGYLVQISRHAVFVPCHRCSRGRLCVHSQYRRRVIEGTAANLSTYLVWTKVNRPTEKAELIHRRKHRPMFEPKQQRRFYSSMSSGLWGRPDVSFFGFAFRAQMSYCQFHVSPVPKSLIITQFRARLRYLISALAQVHFMFACRCSNS